MRKHSDVRMRIAERDYSSKKKTKTKIEVAKEKTRKLVEEIKDKVFTKETKAEAMEYTLKNEKQETNTEAINSEKQKPQLQRIDSWLYNNESFYSSCNNVVFKTEKGVEIKIPVSVDLFKKLEKILLEELKDDFIF